MSSRDGPASGARLESRQWPYKMMTFKFKVGRFPLESEKNVYMDNRL
jgi:hypothetical protein